MSARLRVRFWVEAVLAVIATILFALTLVAHDWIELVFGADPDGGDGSLESIVLGAFLAAALVFAALARVELRRPGGGHVRMDA
jgi:hypothetical protein